MQRDLPEVALKPSAPPAEQPGPWTQKLFDEQKRLWGETIDRQRETISTREVEIARLREALRECEAELQGELDGLLDSACSLDKATGEPIRGTEDAGLKPDIERIEALLIRVRAALSKHGG